MLESCLIHGSTEASFVFNIGTVFGAFYSDVTVLDHLTLIDLVSS